MKLTDLPPSVRAQIQSEPAKSRPQRHGRGVRRVVGEMNGLERDYADELDMRKLSGEVLEWWFDAVKLRLAGNTFYTTDFLVMLADGTLEIHEVKGGFIEDDAAVKLKVAAASYPFVFRLVRRPRKRGPWEITSVGKTQPVELT